MWLFADTDVWAVPMNTLLLVILAVVTAYTAKEHRTVKKRDIPDIKKKLGMTKRVYDTPNHKKVPDTGARRRLTDSETPEKPEDQK